MQCAPGIVSRRTYNRALPIHRHRGHFSKRNFCKDKSATHDNVTIIGTFWVQSHFWYILVSEGIWKRNCNYGLSFIGMSVRRSSRSGFGRSTGNDVSGRCKRHYFPFPLPFFSVATFSHRRDAKIKKLILRKLLWIPENLGVDTFPDPIGHFGASWWILQVVRRCRQWASAPGAARLVLVQYS